MLRLIFVHSNSGSQKSRVGWHEILSATTAKRRFETCSNVLNAQIAAIPRQRKWRVKSTLTLWLLASASLF